MALQSQMRCGTLDDIPGLSDDIKRMYQILKRMESNQSIGSTISDFDISDIEEELDSDDDEDPAIDGDLTNRLEGIDLNDANAIWSKLTENERQEFGQIVTTEDVSAILPEFNPWWEQKIKKQLITEVESESDANNIIHPKIFEGISDFSKISTKPPAACVKNNLCNVLAAYATTVRFYCGEHFTNPQEAASYLLLICANLKSNANFDDTGLAIESIRYEANNEGFSIDDGDVQKMKKDIDNIKEGSDSTKQSNEYILAALSDLHQLLRAAKSEKKSKDKIPSASTSAQEGQSLHFSPPKEKVKQFDDFFKRFADHTVIGAQSVDKTKLSASIKKVEYYLAFVKQFH